jgi:hypothetical protein
MSKNFSYVALQLLMSRCRRLVTNNRISDALELLDPVGIHSHDTEAVLYKAQLLINLKRFQEAENLLLDEIRFDNDNTSLQVFLGQLYQRLGRWDQCWSLTESTVFKQQKIMGCGPGDMPSSLNHIKAQGRRPRVLCYQDRGGLGDCIQFLRFLNHPCLQDVDLCLRVPAVLQDLVACNFPTATVQAAATGHVLESTRADFDIRCTFFSLPAALGLTQESQLRSDPYIHCDAAQAQCVRTKVRAPQDSLIMGFQWRGSDVSLGQGPGAERSIPLTCLDDFVPGSVSIVSLRKDTVPAEQQWMCHWGIIDVVDVIMDLAQTAAVISHLDFVVTIDTSTAHLAGAMGKPTYLLLPYSSAPIWLENRLDTPWYTSMQLIRQKTAGDWHDCAATLRILLRRDWGI